jgi:histidinol-phosphatase
MLLAEGLVDIVAEFDVQAYDLAAHVPIVREAGGRFTDIEGSESAWNGSSLATNGALHDAVIETIDREHGAAGSPTPGAAR